MIYTDFRLKKSYDKLPRVLIAAGGSGGHVIPAQVVAKELRQRGYYVHFAAADLALNRFFGKHEFEYTDICSLPFSLTSPWKLMSFMKNLAKGLKDGYQLLKALDPEVVIGFGSYHTVSILAASWIKKVPIILHEANAYPGDVIQLFAKCAEFVGCYFPEAAKLLSSSVTKSVDIPIRQEIVASLQMDKKVALDRYGFAPGFPSFLVVGGSQGAKGMNRIVPDALIHVSHIMQKEDSQKPRIQVLHISGNQEEAVRLKEYYRMHKELIIATVIPYESHMEYAYKACDVAIARSGASTVAELSFLNIPTIFIPYPHAKRDHQLLNARASLDMKECFGEVISEDTCSIKGSSRRIAEILFALFQQRRASMKSLIQRVSFIDEVENFIQSRIQVRSKSK